MTRALWIAIAFCITPFLVFDANAHQLTCGARADVLTSLSEQYSERPTAMGLDNFGNVIEILSSPSGTFTILVTLPNGTTCMMSVGDSWEQIDPIKESGFRI